MKYNAKSKKWVGRRWVVELPSNDERIQGVPHNPNRNDFVPFMSFYAQGYDKARAIGEELFGEDVLVSEFSLPSGYKVDKRSGKFFVKSTSYGQKYLCVCCRNENLGIRWSGVHMHRKWCPYFVDPSVERVRP